MADSNSTIYNSNNPSVLSGINPNDLMTEIQDKLLNTSGAISSSNSKIEDTITGAIDKLTQSSVSSKAATELAYNKKISTATTEAEQKEASFLEAQRGYATNTAALRDLRTTNAKAIQELEDSKQMALLSADSETASKISDLILKKYEFEQNATQQVFNNLVSLNNIALQNAQESRLAKTAKLGEESAKSEIALKYGVEINEGDTLQDVVNRAKPNATEKQKLELDQLQASIEQTKSQTQLNIANAAKALRDDKSIKFYDNESISVLIQDQLDSDPKITLNQLKKLIATDEKIKDKTFAYSKAEELFNAKKTGKDVSSQFSGSFKSPLLNTLAQFGESDLNPANISKNILDYIFGTK